MARARTLTLKTKVEVTGADKLNNLGKKLQRTGGILTAGLTVPILGIGAAIAQAAEEAAQADAELGRVFDSMNAATFTSIDALKKQQQELQNTTTFADEEISHVQSVLLTFGNVTGDAFTRATEAAADMSALLGQDLQSSAVQLGKALNDPIKGLTALRRVGVAFTEQQQEQIRVMTEAGDVAGAQALILDELEREFGGAAEAMASTAGGQFKQAMNQLGDAAEEFGAVLAPVIKDIAGGIREFAKWLKDLNPETKEWVVRLGLLLAALGPISLALGTILRLSGPFVALWKFFAVKDAATNMTTAAKALSNMGTSLGGMAAFAGSLIPLFVALGAFAADAGGIKTTFGKLKDTFGDFTNPVSFAADQVERLFDLLSDDGPDAVAKLTPALEKSEAAWQTYEDVVSRSVAGTVQTVQLGVDEMAEDAGDLPEMMADEMLAAQFHLSDAIDQLVNVMENSLTPAQQIFQAQGFLASKELAEGLASGDPTVRKKAAELAQAARDTIAQQSLYNSGKTFSASFAAGMVDPVVISFVKQSAYRVALAARGIFPSSEPKDPNSPLRGITKGFGFGEVFAKGLLTGQSAVTSALSTLVGGVTLPSASFGARPAVASGPSVVNNWYLQWQGEPPRARSEEEIISKLDRFMAVAGF